MRERGFIGKKDRKEVGLAFVGSVLLHLLILLILLILTLASPSKPLAALPPEEVPMEITIIPPPPPPAEPPPPTFVDTSTAEEAPAPPEDTRFESDRDTVAASETDGTGSPDMPSVEGRDESYLELASQQMQLGPETPSQPAPPEQPREEAQLPQEVEEQPEETLPEEEPEPAPDEIVLTRPPEVRRAEPIAPDQVRQEVRRAQVPESASAAAAGFQPERRATRIEGGVNNRGRASVAAMSTPLGRYKKALSDAIGSRWYFYVSNDLGLFSIGTATIQFVVTASGRVSSVRVISNSSNESFASVSIRSIMDAEIPPIPPEVAEHLENNRIEVDFTFSILAN